LVVLSATDLKNVGHVPAAWPIIFVGDPSFTRGRVESYFIAWPYGATGTRVAAGIFRNHSFNCHGLLSFS
jgi:hypothetical protein